MGCQLKELEYEGGQRQVHDACIVCTVVGEKAHLGMKLNSEEIKPVFLSIVELCYAGGIS